MRREKTAVPIKHQSCFLSRFNRAISIDAAYIYRRILSIQIKSLLLMLLLLFYLYLSDRVLLRLSYFII